MQAWTQYSFCNLGLSIVNSSFFECEWIFILAFVIMISHWVSVLYHFYLKSFPLNKCSAFTIYIHNTKYLFI